MARIGGDPFLRFDTGISTVHRADEPARLPDEGVAPVVETRPVQLVDALYDMPTFDERLLAAAARTLPIAACWTRPSMPPHCATRAM